MCALRDEIHEQPTVLERMLERQEAVREIARHVATWGRRGPGLRQVLLAARGTSDNAGQYGKYLLGAANGLPVALAAPSLYTLYGAPPRLAGALVLGISQSGASPDICAVIEDARRQGAPTVVLTNAPDSPLARVAEHVVDLGAGPERSVAATKTYTAELLALALLSAHLAEDAERLEALRAVPEAVAAALALDAPIAQRAERYLYMPHCAVVGRGYNYATALEIALKVKELTYVGATPYSSADFRHGPIAVVDRAYPVILVAPSGAVYADVVDLLDALREREAEIIVLSDREEALAAARTALRLPGGVPEWLSPIVAAIPGQLLAYHLALAKDLDPERPRGLRKVTETR
jgi:glucosamine--fructose-6-phosphate aminotransferase (isomerizing)